MDKKINFNISANSYFPKNLRQQKQSEKSKFEDIVTEVDYDNQVAKVIEGNTQGYKNTENYPIQQYDNYNYYNNQRKHYHKANKDVNNKHHQQDYNNQITEQDYNQQNYKQKD